MFGSIHETTLVAAPTILPAFIAHPRHPLDKVWNCLEITCSTMWRHWNSFENVGESYFGDVCWSRRVEHLSSSLINNCALTLYPPSCTPKNDRWIIHELLARFSAAHSRLRMNHFSRAYFQRSRDPLRSPHSGFLRLPKSRFQQLKLTPKRGAPEVKKADKTHFQEHCEIRMIGQSHVEVWKVKVTGEWFPENWFRPDCVERFCGKWGEVGSADSNGMGREEWKPFLGCVCAPISKKTSFQVEPAKPSTWPWRWGWPRSGNVTRQASLRESVRWSSIHEIIKIQIPSLCIHKYTEIRRWSLNIDRYDKSSLRAISSLFSLARCTGDREERLPGGGLSGTQQMKD